MSDAPLLSKMDALLKKHRGEHDPLATSAGSALHAAPAASPPAWLPVLTQVIERGVVPNSSAPPDTQATSASDITVVSQPMRAQETHERIEPLLRSLIPQLRDELMQTLTRDLHASLDQALASVDAQLEARLLDIIRDALSRPPVPPKP